jgi:enamine deaminase RidA (YjgF/YER057c/UK114 family)
MDQYQIFHSQSDGSFSDQADDLCLQLQAWLNSQGLSRKDLRYSKVFLSDSINQYDDFMQSSLYHDLLVGHNCTVVGQAPADGSKIALLVKTGQDDGFLFQSLRLTPEDITGDSSYLQTLTLFERYINGLKEKNLNIRDHLIRTWIYVADIDDNYAGIVRARNDVFRRYGLTAETHFVASTGIGGYSQTRHAKVAIDFLTLPSVKAEQLKYLHATSRLNPTQEYGVAFERGTRLTLADKKMYYISGTASIDSKGHVLYLGQVEKQVERLLGNIEALLADGGATMDDVQYFIVYLRDFADRAVVGEYMQAHFPQTPFILLHAKVCRPEWLVEMECVAEKY